MKAFRANITVILNPRVIGPEAPEAPEWDKPDAAFDYMSGLLSEREENMVLDWAYTMSPTLGAWQTVEIGDPDTYEEGDAIPKRLTQKEKDELLTKFGKAVDSIERGDVHILDLPPDLRARLTALLTL